MPGLSYGFLSSALTATDVQVLSTLTLSTSTYHRSIASLRAPLSQGIYFQSYKLYQEVHGPYCSPRETVSINYMYTFVQLLHDHTCTCTTKMIKRKTLSPYRELNVPYLYKFWSPFPKGCFVTSLVEISLVVLQKMS